MYPIIDETYVVLGTPPRQPAIEWEHVGEHVFAGQIRQGPRKLQSPK